MKNPFFRWLVLMLAVWVADFFFAGIRHDSWQSLAVAALVLALLNTLLKPVLALLSLPFIIVTLGFFLLVINAALLKLTAWIMPGDSFVVASWWDALGGGLVISLVNLLFSRSSARVEVKGQRRGDSGRRPPPGQGPVIDI
ncbi:MAG: phage holin family protein [Candidatus Methylacidiphilales bacterium]|nr:phage holin family protein [Candidatus Methylacidiphilales bacterium]